ncbi:MAG: thioredoxin domain-containing protein, partial [Gammaproteobacteria bacterium]|nr:thioredoxin domain-containing protein [Gammaproteobacteria bacterium]
MSEELEKSLRMIEAQKSGLYEKRTDHKDADGNPLFINHLIREDSPYLLQHAHNPVNWHSWGDQAFAAAVAEDKPIFLSIGYSTCHWCHGMEAESFDNVEIARLLNKSFISIKLDREQFPDIDDYYMTGVQIISGQGGWPMSNFLLPDGRPFYAATYFPPAQFAELLKRISQLWGQKRADLEQSAERTAQGIQQVLQGRQEVKDIELGHIMAAADRMLQREDQESGGLAGAPKFPQEPLLYYFLDGAYRSRDLRKMQFLDRALSRMAQGGIYDQVGGGFHRYSTDAQWLVPHFEKMLYNQSQLSLLYLRAWRLSGRPFFLRVVRQTLDYVLREMQQPQGGFYSATDADSEDQEGLFFVWSMTELREILSPDELELAIELYAPSEIGNFEGSNILALQQPLDDPGLIDHRLIGHRLIEQPDGSQSGLDRMLEKLLLARQVRVAPLRDDKVIVAWSAAMASSLAWSGWELQEPCYLDAARRAVDFIWEHNYQAPKQLFRIWLNGKFSIPAQLEDYANLCEALIALFDITDESDYLEKAAGLMQDLLDLFWNEGSGGLYLGPGHQSGPSLARSGSAVDGATLSSYSVAVACLAMLSEREYLLNTFTSVEANRYDARLQQAVSAASAELDEYPPSHVTLIRALRHHLEGSVSPIRYGAGGRLKLTARRNSDPQTSDAGSWVELKIMLSTLAGYHVTTESGDNAQLEPLRVELADDEQHWQIESVDLMSATKENGEKYSALYTGHWLLKIVLSATGTPADLLSNSVGIELLVQV